MVYFVRASYFRYQKKVTNVQNSNKIFLKISILTITHSRLLRMRQGTHKFGYMYVLEYSPTYICIKGLFIKWVQILAVLILIFFTWNLLELKPAF